MKTFLKETTLYKLHTEMIIRKKLKVSLTIQLVCTLASLIIMQVGIKVRVGNLPQINKHAGRNNHAGGKNLENSINVQVEKFQRMAKTRLDKSTVGIKNVLIDE